MSAAAVRVVAVVIRPDQSESLRWQQHGERVLYKSPWVTVTKVDVTPPDGNRFEHHAVRLQRVAMAVVVDDAERVLMVWSAPTTSFGRRPCTIREPIPRDRGGLDGGGTDARCQIILMRIAYRHAAYDVSKRVT